MKRILLLCTILLSASTFANNWEHMEFPKTNPYFQSVKTKDINNSISLEFSCSSSFKDLILVSLYDINLKNNKGTFEFMPSKEDKSSQIIKGNYTISGDGVVNLLTGEQKNILFDFFGKYHGTNLKIDGEQYTFDLKGSSKSLNIFSAKCKNLK